MLSRCGCPPSLTTPFPVGCCYWGQFQPCGATGGGGGLGEWEGPDAGMWGVRVLEGAWRWDVETWCTVFRVDPRYICVFPSLWLHSHFRVCGWWAWSLLRGFPSQDSRVGRSPRVWLYLLAMPASPTTSSEAWPLNEEFLFSVFLQPNPLPGNYRPLGVSGLR